MDGLEINPSGPGLFTTEYEITLPAGDHNLEISYKSGGQYSVCRQQLNVTLQATRRYIIKPLVKGWQWHPVLIDVTDKPQYWTLSVGTLLGPKGCD